MEDIITCGHIQIADLAIHKNQGMELTYITKGRMEWVVDGEVEVVQQGDIFFTLPWQLHGSPVLQQPENEAWHILFRLPGGVRQAKPSFKYPKNLGMTAREMQRLSRVYARSKRHAWPANARIKALFPWMVQEFQSRSLLSQSNRYHLLSALLIELGRVIESEPRAELHASDSELRVAQYLESLKLCCGEEWTLDSMAQSCGVQRTRFSNLVRKLTGFTPMNHLMRVRIDRARDMLRDPQIAITEIAMSCGFSSSQYFANVFRKCVGLSPSEYREHFPELYKLEVESDAIPWRSIEEEKARVKSFQYAR